VTTRCGAQEFRLWSSRPIVGETSAMKNQKCRLILVQIG
jgi:hypothetical protein